jgi:hypothetical protein
VYVEHIFELRESFAVKMDEDGELTAEEKVVANQNDEVAVEATEEEQWQANPRYKTTTNTSTKGTWPWPMAILSSMTGHLGCSLCCSQIEILSSLCERIASSKSKRCSL